MSNEELGLAEKVMLLDDAFVNAEFPHAFGGAIAFAYYGEQIGRAHV